MTSVSYIDALEFRADGDCTKVDPEIFFPKGPGPSFTQARKVCEGCPVLELCREYAIKHEKHGFWGGMSEKQRNRERRIRGIKVDVPSSQWWNDYYFNRKKAS